MARVAAQNVADLSGETVSSAIREIERAGFVLHGTTRGGYREFRHFDGSGIWIRPTGEIIRLGPKEVGKKHRQRYNQFGMPTTLHSTGETLKDR
jgi:hypothetical protein